MINFKETIETSALETLQQVLEREKWTISDEIFKLIDLRKEALVKLDIPEAQKTKKISLF